MTWGPPRQRCNAKPAAGVRREAAWRLLAATLLLLGGRLCRPCAADDYPNRPIQVIVPFSPGGSTDAMARHIKREIEERQLLPQPLVIVNIEGAGSAIGSRRAKNAKPDGYTLMVLNEAIITSKYWGTVPYGPEAFEAIAGTGEAGTVLTIADTERPSDDSQNEGRRKYFEDLGDFLRHAKEHPRTIRAAVALGTPSHFACLSAQAALPGAELRHAQVGGGAHRFTALKGGHVDISTFSTDEFRRFRGEGLRGLAYLGAQRHPDLPDVPTAKEQGFDIQRSIMLYWWAPLGTPPDRLQVIGDALEEAMQGERLRARLLATGVEPVFLRGEALQKKLATVEAEIQSVDPRQQVALPNLVLWTLAAIAALAVWSWAETRETDKATKPTMSEAERPHAGRVLGALGLNVLFVLLLASGSVPLGAAIAVFMIACGATLGAFHSRMLGAVLVLLAVGLAAGFHWIFTRLFVVDL